MKAEQRIRVQALLSRGRLSNSEIAKQAGVSPGSVAAVKAWMTIRDKRRRAAEQAGKDLPAASARRKSGAEPIHRRGKPLDATLLKFWQWSDSDLLSNAVRGRLAEFIVALALKVARKMRREWVAFDLETRDGVSVEVKSASYIQTWAQRRDSAIVFDVRPTLGWNPDLAKFGESLKRQADVYVFALLKHRDRWSVDPLDVDHWTFYVLPTRMINTRLAKQKTVSLGSLLRLEPEEVRFGGVRAAVAQAVGRGL